MTRWVLGIGILSALLAFSCFAEDAPRNLLANGDFAQAGKDGRPVGWKSGGNRYCAQQGAKMEITYDRSAPLSEGFPAVKVTRDCPPGGKSEYRFQSEPFPVVHGRTYRFTVWLRAEAPMTIRLAFDGCSADLARKLGKDYRHWWSRPEGEARVDDQWREFSTTATIPGPNDAGYMADMKTVCVRLVSPNGTFWAAKAPDLSAAPAPRAPRYSRTTAATSR